LHEKDEMLRRALHEQGLQAQELFRKDDELTRLWHDAGQVTNPNPTA